MDTINYFFNGIKKTFNYRDKATNSEFWYFLLYYWLFSILITILDLSLDSNYMLFYILTIFPLISIAVRRLNDAGKSPFWVLINFVPLGFIYLVYLLTLPSLNSADQFTSLKIK